MLVATDHSDKEIAFALGISRRTVRTHLERFYRTHSVHSRAGAVARWLILQRDSYP
jgi:DNA-binding CsgD family transcriptional regulator